LRGGSVYLNSLARFTSGLRIAATPLREAAGGCIADRDLFTEHNAGEGCAGELAALIGVEDIGLIEARQRFL
jgi:hypothetical protein